MIPLTLAVILFAGAVYMYRRNFRTEEQPPSDLTDERIKQQWRELGFFCELDDEKKIWTLTGSRAGLLFFPDLLLGYIADPANASDGNQKHYGPYGSLQIMTWPEAGFGNNAIRGSLVALAHLAELIEAKLASAQPGERLRIRDEFAADSPYTLLLDVRADGFDPSSADRESLGVTAAVSQKQAPKEVGK